MIAEVHDALTRNIQKQRHQHINQTIRNSRRQIYSKTSLLGEGRAKVQCHAHGMRATVSGVVISRDEISFIAGGVAGLASGRRADVGVIVGNSETGSGERRVVGHVNAGKIPEDSGIREGVLVLQDISVVRSGGHLDRDAATIRVEAPFFGVLLTGGESNHWRIGCVADGPQVDGRVHVVDDVDTTSGAVVAALHGSRKSRSQSAERGDGSNGLGEHHPECVFLFLKRKVISNE